MEEKLAEAQYPLTFREEDAKTLGEHLKNRHSVDVVGMKRVGISNFLRYFLYHHDVTTHFISKEQKHVLIPVDLNDLVEREIYPFWTLTFKRILDEVEKNGFSEDLRRRINANFLSSIQSQDLFLLIDGIRRSLQLIIEEGYLPTLFFLRFDRIKSAVTPEFFDNLQGLQDATHMKLSYVFTSYRTLDVLSPEVFQKATLAVFTHTLYVKPSNVSDMEVICEVYKKRYELSLPKSLYKDLFDLVGGSVQYLQLALILLHEQREKKITTKEQLFELLINDERLILQSEELWDSLAKDEKELLIKINKGEKYTEDERKKAVYIFDSGIVNESDKKKSIFSPLFTEYISKLEGSTSQLKDVVFSKKEHLLFSFLQSKLGEICEREQIIEFVWPEYVEYGVSDWSIDRLVARVRQKLRQQASQFEIKTIRTRGYVLLSKV